MSDLVITGGTVVTMDATRRVLRADVRIREDRIVEIGEIDPAGCQTLDASGAMVIPGLVQAHVHLCQALFRGMADDLPLLEWLKQRIWPFEAAHTHESLRASADLGLAEMILAGTTTILDMGTVHHQDAVFEAMEASGIRGFSGKAMMDLGDDVPEGLRETTEESLAESHRLQETWEGAAGGRLRYAYAPRFILSCSEELLRGVADAAKARKALVHSHVAEHADERAAVQELLGMSDIAALAASGIEGVNVVLAHGVQLTREEMRSMATAGTRVTHCPSANLKLASGIADVPMMRSEGLIVALGADGAPCNNRMDPWTELRSAALLAKAKYLRADVLPAAEAFELVTIDGARALGLEKEIGSLEVGKKADICVVGDGALHQLPGGDVYSKLVYSTVASDVRHVMCDGAVLVESGIARTLNVASVASAAKKHAARLGA